MSELLISAEMATLDKLCSCKYGHRKARLERPAGYPGRFPVDDAHQGWDCELPGYDPVYHVAAVVLDNDMTRNPKGWADPEDVYSRTESGFESFEGEVFIDDLGRPRNPRGRTGIAGRGLLGRWGANYAADPLVSRVNRQTGHLEMLAIQRRDTGQWAIPGGMVDKGEEITRTLARELAEETGVTLDMSQGVVIYRGYVDDPRNTDHAWMETTVKHLHLPPGQGEKLGLQAGDDAKAVRWLPLTVASASSLYASHCTFVAKMLLNLIVDNKYALTACTQAAALDLLRSLVAHLIDTSAG